MKRRTLFERADAYVENVVRDEHFRYGLSRQVKAILGLVGRKCYLAGYRAAKRTALRGNERDAG